ncbi:MAG: multiheme c-type cytochrome [bacterium]
MGKVWVVAVAVAASVGLLWSGQTSKAAGKGSTSAQPYGATYVGSAKCSTCHKQIYDTFMKSGHPWKVSKVVDGKAPERPFTQIPSPPEGYSWSDISYLIGGYAWKARFMDKKGYIITGKDEKAKTQWNFANPVVGKEAGWVAYNPGKKEMKYDCGPCHTTGYRPTGNQDNLPGIVGTWAEPGIQCEACHGPGSLHAENPYGVKAQVVRDSELCGKCHRRGAVEMVDAKGGFIEHHEQYEELFQSKHVILNCSICHDPHTGVIQLRQANKPTTRTQCTNCHFEKAKYQASDAHKAMEVACIDCHMPRITKSAWGDPARFTGDIRTHMMAIDPDQIGQFTKDGKYALSQLSLDFACRHCHVQGGKASPKSDEELKAKAKGYHRRT